jgi:hypothetical protein
MSTGKPDQDERSGPLSELQAEVQRRAVEMAAKQAAGAALEGASRAGHGLLDAVESLLFGEKGGAQKLLEREESADPLARIRSRHQLGEDSRPAAATAPAAPDPVAEARARLEKMKAELKARKEGPVEGEIKKTL